MDHSDSSWFELNWLCSANIHGYDCDDTLWESRSGLCLFPLREAVCSQQQSDGTAASAEWCQAWKSFSPNDSSHLYESGCLSSEWCVLLLLHLKRFTANMYVKAPLNQTGQPVSSVTAGLLCQYQLLYKRHKHIGTLINAIKWSSASCAWLHRA